ncbi:hypothetical protein J2Z83_003280 [Virgibacillus natechei]|uniref:Uncharacterized protein n=1 Tax=Virgibacillus natechei TaxID=1216297 RepID=A0ABS4IL57_9BACI|nr:hypothetical protein [Virgibacillus natechei]
MIVLEGERFDEKVLLWDVENFSDFVRREDAVIFHFQPYAVAFGGDG